MISSNRAIFLDRDGIIIHAKIIDDKPFPVSTLEEVKINQNVVESLNRLVNANYLLIGITNQPDVARGTQLREVTETINSFIMRNLPLKAIYTCYHDDSDNCLCRKPKPGLILQAATDYNIILKESWMVGDRWKDIAAGQAAGTKTIFVDYKYNEYFYGPPADYTIQDISLLADIILNFE